MMMMMMMVTKKTWKSSTLQPHITKKKIHDYESSPNDGLCMDRIAMARKGMEAYDGQPKLFQVRLWRRTDGKGVGVFSFSKDKRKEAADLGPRPNPGLEMFAFLTWVKAAWMAKVIFFPPFQ